MSAEIVDFMKVRAERVRQEMAPAFMTTPGLPKALSPTGPQFDAGTGLPGFAPRNSEAGPSFQFWTGASGARYVHSVYHLFECPPFDEANYVLVKRHEGGRRTVLAIGRAANAAPSLNLAELRQRAAQLGANEVHLHLLASGQDDSRRIEADLRGSLVLA